MKTIARSNFTTVKTEGALLPPDLLQKIADGKAAGLQPQDYHLGANERLNEAINRSWNRLLGVWQDFQQQMQLMQAGESAITLTRRRWLDILFQELGYGRLQYQRGFDLPDATGGESQASQHYPINYRWEHVPILIVSFQQKLDERDATIKRSPHSLLQEFLNRSNDHQWGFVSNGLALRILRDNASLTRAAYVEFDLDAMLTGEQYADFSLLWLLCHQSRLEFIESPSEAVEVAAAEDDEEAIAPAPVAISKTCWLERWSQSAVEDGTRAWDKLRDGVQAAIEALGQGFLRQPNRELKIALQQGKLSKEEYYYQLLRLVYRLIFLLVAEERDLLLLPDTPAIIQTRYQSYYSIGRLRTLSEARRGGPHLDLYRSLRLLFVQLRDGYKPLGLPALGSFLFSDRATPALDAADIANYDMLNVIRALTITSQGKVRRAVDYKNLGAEELGSVYESLLELHPQINIDAATFALTRITGSDRKTSGSYYTPTSLITCLLDSALEPVVADRLQKVKGQDRAALADAILKIKVVDPACGSGHFLIAAANRLALHLARIRTGDGEPSPSDRRAALRDVVHHCIHGVDINPMAVELCKVALWMETLDRGKPLGFLDRNIQCGNSLLGATPALLRRGIPDEAFTAILGDNKEYASRFKKQNKQERTGTRSFDSGDFGPWQQLGKLAEQIHYLTSVGDETVDDVRFQEEYYAEVNTSPEYRASRLWADAWCAAFVWVKKDEDEGGFAFPITEQIFRSIEKQPERCAEWMAAEIERLASQYQFFHWHLAFPDIFEVKPTELADDDVAGWIGGFDIVLGNPPWEKINLKDEEFFASSYPEIANASNKAIRKKLIEELKKIDFHTYHLYYEAQSMHDRISQFFRLSSRFPFTGVSRINLYSIFAELAIQNVCVQGRTGLVLASGIATDDNNKALFEDLVKNKRLVSVWDFENREGIFPAVDSRFKFCTFCSAGKDIHQENAKFAFYLTNVQQLKDEQRIFTLSHADLIAVNPTSKTAPTFRNKREAEITKGIYQRIYAWCLHREKEDWPGNPKTPFNMSNDSGLFSDYWQLISAGGSFGDDHRAYLGKQQYLPLYESKFIHQFNHRYASVEENNEQVTESSLLQLDDPIHTIKPLYWMAKGAQAERYPGQWFLAYRMITNATNERTGIASLIPGRPCSNSLTIVDSLSAPNAMILCINMNSFVHDFVARHKVPGTNFNHWIWKQLPVPSYAQVNQICQRIADDQAILWLVYRFLELCYVAYDLRPFSQDCGYHGPPFRWDEARRFLLRCELDAAYFHLYSIARDDVEYIMETFPIVKRKDIAAHGEYRTKRVILEIYDEMATAMHGGQPYQTRLNPPPADPAAAHPWDEKYLGAYQEPSTWWREVTNSTKSEDGEILYTANTTTSRVTFNESRPAYTVAPVTTTAATQLGLGFNPKVWPAPSGNLQERLERIIALAAPSTGSTSEDNLRELTAFLADPQASVRTLATQVLRQHSSSLLVAILDDFYGEAESARVAIAKPEISQLLQSMVETAKEKETQGAAQKLLARITN